MLFKKAVSSELLSLIIKILSLKEFEDFRLVGGTALALQLGHRTSVDIDLFSEKSINKNYLSAILSSNFTKVKDIRQTSFGFTCFINDIKTDFNWDGGRFIQPPKKEKGITMASLEDLCATKLNAISNRATQKDFYDIAVLIEKFSIRQMIQFYREKYPFLDVREPIDNFKKHYLAGEENPVHPLIPLTWMEATNRINNAFDLFVKELKLQKQKQIEERFMNIERRISKNKK